MKKPSVIAIAAGLFLAVVVGIGAQRVQTRVTNASLSGAFRDGVYQAKLDAEFGRKPLLRTGRWQSDTDRAAFLAGYQQGSDKSRAVANLPSQPELVGFRNGLADGTDARRTAQPFSLRSGIVRVSHGHLENGLERDPEYMRAYVNGYQYGYYTNQETLQSEVTGTKLNQF